MMDGIGVREDLALIIYTSGSYSSSDVSWGFRGFEGA